MIIAIKHRLQQDWLPILLWLIGISFFCFLQKELLLDITYQPYHTNDMMSYNIEGYSYSSKTVIYLASIFIINMIVFTYILYRDYENGKKRYMFLRKHQYVWFVSNTMILFLLMVICYGMMYWMLNDGLISTIQDTQKNLSTIQLETFYQEAVHSNRYISQVMHMDLRHTGENLLWLLTISMWCHIFATTRQYHKQTMIDIMVVCSIVPLVLAFAHSTMVMISLLLCIIYAIYIKDCWHPKRMYA